MATLLHRLNGTETLRGLAVRYFGDQNRWGDIAIANDLSASAIANLNLAGLDALQIPIDVGPATGQADSTNPFFTDLATQDGGLVLGSTADLAVVTGRDNVIASLTRALTTQLTKLLAHPRYGLDLDSYVAEAGNALFLRFLRAEATRVILRDPRVDAIKSASVVAYPRSRQIAIAASGTLVGGKDSFDLTARRTY